jgi:hypothetical protein
MPCISLTFHVIPCNSFPFLDFPCLFLPCISLPCLVLALCNLPKAVEAVTEATSKPLRVLDIALQDSDRDIYVWYKFVCRGY